MACLRISFKRYVREKSSLVYESCHLSNFTTPLPRGSPGEAYLGLEFEASNCTTKMIASRSDVARGQPSYNLNQQGFYVGLSNPTVTPLRTLLLSLANEVVGSVFDSYRTALKI